MARANAVATLPGVYSLFLESLRAMRGHLGQLLSVAAVGTTVSLLLKNNDVLASLWFMFFSCVLIWSIRHLKDPKVKVTIRNAYYQGTAPLLRFLLTLLVVSLASIPLSLALLLYQSMIGIAVSGFMQVEFIVISAVSLLLTGLSFYLLVRVLFALVIITLPDITPIQAVRISWGLTQRQTLRLLRLWLVFLVCILLTVGMVLALTAVGSDLPLIEYLIDLTTGLLIMPWFYLLLFITYKKLT